MSENKAEIRTGTKKYIHDIEQDLIRAGYRLANKSIGEEPGQYEYITNIASGSERHFEGQKRYSIKWYEKETVSLD